MISEKSYWPLDLGVLNLVLRDVLLLVLDGVIVCDLLGPWDLMEYGRI
jgi:hypothetical protein